VASCLDAFRRLGSREVEAANFGADLGAQGQKVENGSVLQRSLGEGRD